MNKRDTLLALLALGLTVCPLSNRAVAQAPGKPYRIGLVPDFMPAWEPMLKAFTGALAELGRVEGRDYTFIRSGVFYGPETQQALERVMAAKPDLIFTMNLGYAVAARKLTRTIPVVMGISGFPVEGGVAESLGRPGGNVTGLTIFAGGEVFGKLVQMVHEVKPSVKRIGVLMSYVPPFHPQAETDLIKRGFREAAQALGVEVRIHEIATPEQVDDALAAMVRQGVEALVLTSGAATANRRHDVMRFAVERRLPTIVDVGWESAGDPQPLLQYEADIGVLMRQAAPYANKILWQGARPGELPIQLPARFKFGVNLKTAKALGITIPQPLLLRADEVIQ